MAHTHATAPAQVVEALGIRCACRRFGKEEMFRHQHPSLVL
jgi:hypothetical protein